MEKPDFTDESDDVVKHAMQAIKDSIADPDVDRVVPMIVLKADGLHLVMAMPKGLDQHYEVIRKLAETFHPHVLLFVYDGYATMLDKDKGECPECLGEDPDRESCATCYGTGVATSMAKQDAVICIDMRRGVPPVVHHSLYTRTGGKTRFSPIVSLTNRTGAMTDSGYPTLNEKGIPE